MVETICPHWKNFSEEDFELLFTKASLTRKSNEQMFYYTHTPVKVKDTNGNILDESEILNEFRLHDPRKVVIIIQGNTGTGKSELCVHLSFELDKKSRDVFHIDKNSSLMDILTRDIPNFYEDKTGEKFSTQKQLNLLGDHIASMPEVIAAAATSGLIIQLRKIGYLRNFTRVSELKEKLEELIVKNIDVLSEKGENPVDMTFVTKNDLTSPPYKVIMDFLPWSNIDTCVEETNKLLWEEIRSKYSVPSLDEALSELVKKCHSRPVIIFEDFSVAGLDLRKLALFMENDNPDALCDFIIAGLQDKVPARTGTRVDRFKYYETTSSGEQGVLFLDETSCVDFIKPYLDYPKNVKYLENYNDDSFDNPICNKCKKCPKDDSNFTPFNYNFIYRIYSNLDSREQTPRLFVNKIFQILSEYKFRNIIPSDSREVSSLPPPYVVDDVIMKNESDKRLFEWYGELVEDHLILEPYLSLLFDYDLSQYEKNGIIQAPLLTHINSTGTTLGGGIIDTPPSGFEEIMGQVSVWKKNPEADNVQEFFVYFNTGLKELVKSYTNNYSLNPRSNININVGRNEYPFFVKKHDQVLQAVNAIPSQFSQNGALRIAQLGYHIDKSLSRKTGDGRDLLDIAFDANVYPVSKLIFELRENIVENLSDPGWGKYGNPRNAYQICISCISILMTFTDPLLEINEGTIIDWISGNNTDIDFLNKNKLQTTAVRLIDRIIGSQDIIRDLAQDLFGLTTNSFDLLKISDNKGIHPFYILNHAKKNNDFKNVQISDYLLSEIYDPFVRSRIIAENLEEYISNNNIDYDLKLYIENTPSYLKNVEISDVKHKLSILNQYDEIDKELLINMEDLCEYDQEDIEDHLNKIKKIESLGKMTYHNDFVNMRYNLALKQLSEDELTKLLMELKDDIDNITELREATPLIKLYELLELLW